MYYHDTLKLLKAPIEDVLLKFYPAPFLKWLYEISLRQLASDFPGALPQPDRARPSDPDKAPKRAFLVALLQAVLQDPAMERRFFATLPPQTRELIAAATWDRRVNLAALERTLRRQVAMPNGSNHRFCDNPFILPPEHGFLAILRHSDEWYDSYRGDKAKKEDYCLCLPDAIRKAFKAIIPPPPGYELLPLDSVPSSHSQYSCVRKAAGDLRLVAEFIAQGHLTYTKSGPIARSSFKTIQQMTGNSEFYENSDDYTLALLRTRLLVAGMAFAGKKERRALLSCGQSAEPVRDVILSMLGNPSFLHEELLRHIPRNPSYSCPYGAQAVKNLAASFERLPGQHWVAWDNIRSSHVLRDDRPSIFNHGAEGLPALAANINKPWQSSTAVDSDNEFDLVSEPLLKGFAFLLAAFGAAEIAYDPPAHPTYARPGKNRLTPFDGLRFVRLTPLGEFVFGRQDHFDLPACPTARSPVILDETRLLATCRNADKLTELALKQLMEPLAAGRYRMTPKSFLAGCATRGDLEERVRLFRRAVSIAPPAIWEQFFEQTLARSAPLVSEPDYLVLKVGADEEIRRLFTSDPVLKEIVLKVEGLRIAVRQSDLKKLAKRLEEFGYLNPLPLLA